MATREICLWLIWSTIQQPHQLPAQPSNTAWRSANLTRRSRHLESRAEQHYRWPCHQPEPVCATRRASASCKKIEQWASISRFAMVVATSRGPCQQSPGRLVLPAWKQTLQQESVCFCAHRCRRSLLLRTFNCCCCFTRQQAKQKEMFRLLLVIVLVNASVRLTTQQAS